MKKAIVAAFILVALFASYKSRDLRAAATDPIAYWKFDDGSGTTVTDSSGNGINGTLTATAPTWSTDKPSAITFTNTNSLSFMGNGDAVDISWPTERNFAATAPRSFSFWYRPVTNGEGQYSRIISWSNDRLEIAGTNGTSSSHKIAYFDGEWHETNITLSLGTWYHITFTYDGTTAKFYIGSDLQDEHSLAGRSLSGTLRIGNRVQQLDEGINGNIDDVRIYDYALNSTQVSNLSSGSNSPDGDPTPTPTPTPTISNSTSTNTPPGALTNNTTSAPAPCSAQKPASSPNLFQVTKNQSTSTLYFTPVSPVTAYEISYGTDTNANQHSTMFDYQNSSGAVKYTIEKLATNSEYFFKIRGFNDCVPGTWSNILSSKRSTPTPNQIDTLPPVQVEPPTPTDHQTTAPKTPETYS